MKLLEGLAKAQARAIGPRLKAINSRLDALESQVKAMQAGQQKTIADDYAGTWRTDLLYKRGSLTTHRGSLWLALSDNQSTPGNGSDWRMVSKKDFEGKA